MRPAKWFAVLAALSAVAWPQFPGGPLLYSSGPVNAATCSSGVRPGDGIAQGAMFVLRGLSLTGFSPSRAMAYPLPTELGGTAVEIQFGDAKLRAPLISVSFTEVIGVMPSGVPPGEASMTAIYQGSKSQPVAVNVVASNFGIFTLNSPWVPRARLAFGGSPADAWASTGPGFIETFQENGGRSVVTLATPARPGQQIVISGTGLGPLEGDDGTQPFAADIATEVEVLVGGRQAAVISKRRAECCPGVDELVVEVPDNVEGCYVPVAVRAGETTSNFVTTSVAANDGNCADFPGAPASDPAKVQAGEPLRLGEILLARISLRLEAPDATAETTFDFGRAAFASYEANELFRSLAARSFLLAGSPSPGHCLIVPGESTDLPMPVVTEFPPQTDLTGAGDAITISGPLGSRDLLARDGYLEVLGGWFPEIIDQPEPEYLEPGSYTVSNGPGGEDIGPLAAELSIPSQLVWTNRDDLKQIARSEDLTLKWESADPERELVTVVAYSGSSSGSGTPALLCTERASAGQLTVPGWVLSRLLKSESEGGIPFGVLGLVNSPVLYTETASSPGLDSLRLQYAHVQIKNVEFQ